MKKFITIVALSITLIASPANAQAVGKYTRESSRELGRINKALEKFLPQLLEEQKKQTYITCIALHRVDLENGSYAHYSRTVRLCEQYNPGLNGVIHNGQLK